MITDKLIIFTLSDDRRVLLNSDYIEVVEELVPMGSAVRVVSRSIDIEVNMTMDAAMAVLHEVSHSCDRTTNRQAESGDQNPLVFSK